ncbi:MAG: HDOD domain-containing protein, partial [Candidatus Thiodiazotropha sp. 6PDIVS]
EESVQIAAISRVLSYNLDHLDKEQAMLAGLIHNIGALPILAMAESRDELVQDEAELDRVINALSPLIGQRILEMWDFPESLIKVPANFLNLQYESKGDADYSDIVLVARFQANLNPDDAVEVANVPAFCKLGIEPEVNFIEIEGVAEDIQEIEVMFLS